MGKMKASVLYEAKKIILEERIIPKLEADQVLVKISAVGVCGSDIHYYQEGKIGDFVLREPMILGHEAAGVIAAVGSGVSAQRIGKRVSIEPQKPRPDSAETLAGRYNLDPDMQFYATPPIDGAFAEYAVIQSHFAFDIPNNISDNAAALIEPLSVGIAAARKAKITAGSRVFITGAGPIGIICVQVARAFGAVDIIVSDISDSRLALARKYGATKTINVLSASEQQIKDLRVDSVIEASGAPSAISSAIDSLRAAGRLVLVGMGPEMVPVSIPAIQNKELIITGVFRYANTWPIAVALLEAKKIDLDSMVTGVYSLEQVEEAILDAASGRGLKIIVKP